MDLQAFGTIALLLLAGAAQALSPAAAAPTPASAELSTPERDRVIRFIDMLTEGGSLQEASRLARRGMESDTQKSPWLLRLAVIASARHRPAEAAGFYRQLLDLHGESAGILLKIGENLLAAGELDAAQSALERARALDAGPLPLYYLSEAAYARGDATATKKWAAQAIEAMGAGPKTADLRRMRLWMSARLGWDDSIDQGFQKLFEDYPDDPETLAQWIDALLQANLARAAGEPLALLRERFPAEAQRTRSYELRRLQELGDDRAYAALLADSARRWPENRVFKLLLGEQRLHEGRWLEAERLLSSAQESAALEKEACLDLVELHRQYDHHWGPFFQSYQSSSGRIFDGGVGYGGYAREHLRVGGTTGISQIIVPSQSFSRSLADIHGTAAWESPYWTAGADADATTGAGEDTLSPGVLGRWQPLANVGLGADAYWRRAWTSAPEAVAVGAKTDHVGVSWDTNPSARILFGGQESYNNLSVNDGSRASQNVFAPQIAYQAVLQPFYLDVGYRFLAQDAWGEDAFFSKLSLLRKERTHYATLAFGKHWFCGRLRADGYLFNGQDDGRGIRFGSLLAAGAGLSVDWFGKVLHLRAGYDFSQDTQNGIGGTSHSVNIVLERHWYGHEQKNTFH